MGYLPDQLSEQNWSDKQRQFLMANRDSVMKLRKDIDTPQASNGT